MTRGMVTKMYGLPSTVDLSFLNGIHLLQVCVGVNEVILNFYPDVTITITSCFHILDNGVKMESRSSRNCTISKLIDLLDETVIDVKGERCGTLRIAFSGGAVIVLMDDSPEFESYTIRHGDVVIVV